MKLINRIRSWLRREPSLFEQHERAVRHAADLLVRSGAVPIEAWAYISGQIDKHPVDSIERRASVTAAWLVLQQASKRWQEQQRNQELN